MFAKFEEEADPGFTVIILALICVADASQLVVTQ